MATPGAPYGELVDIAVNLTDPMFRGEYRGKQKHESDFDQVLKRAADAGVRRMIITGTNLADSREALEMARTSPDLFCTVGCHPTRCSEFEEHAEGPQAYFDALLQLVQEGQGKVVAIGECGLDYDRLEFCPRETQLKYFELQIALAEQTKLPMFLHLRNAADDFLKIMEQHRARFSGGVVHSFDSDAAVASRLVDMDLFIGINGCSLKTQDNLDTVKTIPVDRIMIETDAPWCDVRPTHAGHGFVKTDFPSRKKERFEMGAMVKSRNEPCCIVQVLEVVAGCRGEPASDVATHVLQNTERLFFPQSQPA